MNLFRKERDNVQSKIDKTKSKLVVKKQLRSEIANLPIPQSDFADLVCEKIDLDGSLSCCRLEQHFISAKSGYIELDGMSPILESFGGGHVSGKINPENIYALLGDQLKNPLREMVMSWDWPKKVGPPRSERKSAIEKLDDEIETLGLNLEDLISKAEADGMKVSY